MRKPGSSSRCPVPCIMPARSLLARGGSRTELACGCTGAPLGRVARDARAISSHASSR
jgi:hypothetical protein